uniref:Uncharacterized protein n=1 Tax=Panagrolaimus sp. PS1159 TaxID=55785 RepID=A0AC35FEH9_9BILA
MWDHFGANNFSRSHEDFCQEQYRFYYRYCDDMENSVRRKRKVLQLNHSYLQQGYDVEFLLTFPNSYLDEVFEKFNMKSDIPVSKDVIKKYQKMKSLYEKIISVETNDEKWFEALTEVNDDEFVEDNIENRLGEDLTNKNLWKIYIDFLRTRNIDKLLHTYSKYCRFWLDDSEMKEEYQKAAEKYGPIKVPWKNSFEFEIYDSQYYLKIMHQNFSHPIVRKLFKHKRGEF